MAIWSVDELCNMALNQIMNAIITTVFVKNFMNSWRSSRNAIYLCDFSKCCVPICWKTLVDWGNLSNGPVLGAVLSLVRNCNLSRFWGSCVIDIVWKLSVTWTFTLLSPSKRNCLPTDDFRVFCIVNPRDYGVRYPRRVFENDFSLLVYMSRDMRFPRMWYVRPAKPQISLGICAVWSEPLLVAWISYDCWATEWTPFGVSKLEKGLHRLLWIYTSCQNATLLEITYRGSYSL